ncbi:MAG: hypothetical protein V4487_01085 [Chlamydiota bacterium]
MLRVQHSSQKDLYQPLQTEVFKIVQQVGAAHKIDRLLRALCGSNIQSMDICNITKHNGVDVTIHLNKNQYKRLNDTTLCIPQKLEFRIHKDGICFDSDAGKNTPYEDQNYCCGILKNRLTWWDIDVKEDDFVFSSPRWVGPGFPICGGTPNVSRVPAEPFTLSLQTEKSDLKDISRV